MKFLSSISNSELGRVGIRVLALGALAYLGQAAIYISTNSTDYDLINRSPNPGSALFSELPRVSFSRLDRIAASNPDVLFLGDSTVMANIEDADRQTTPEILGELLPEIKVEYLYYPGWTLEIYDLILAYLKARGAHPKVVIAPINIRSFSVPWYYLPEMQYPRLRFSLQYGHPFVRPLVRPLLVVKAADLNPISIPEFGHHLAAQYQESIRQFGQPPIKAPDGRMPTLMRRYCSYTFLVENDHPLMHAMQTLDQHAKYSEIPLLLYIAPTDLAHIERTLGAPSVNAVRENFLRIQNSADRTDMTLVNYAYVLNETDFFPVGVTASHLRDTGRRRLAERLAVEVRARFDTKPTGRDPSMDE